MKTIRWIFGFLVFLLLLLGFAAWDTAQGCETDPLLFGASGSWGCMGTIPPVEVRSSLLGHPAKPEGRSGGSQG